MKSKHGFETTEERSYLMQKIKHTNTLPEIKLRKKLWFLGYRYRINNSKILGKPDLVLHKFKLAIFIDGEFWHGYQWNEKKERIISNRDYWIKKIEGNILRDQVINDTLRRQGWIVLRFWSKEVLADLDKCIEIIESHTF